MLGGVLDASNAYLRLRSGCTQTRSEISTAGFTSGVYLKYLWGQQTNNDASDDGDLVVQWKRADSGTWLTLNTHDLANNCDHGSRHSRGSRYAPGERQQHDDRCPLRRQHHTTTTTRLRVDDVLVVPNAAPVAVDDTYTTNEDTNLVLDAVAAGPELEPRSTTTPTPTATR